MGQSCSPVAFKRLIQNVFTDQGSFCKAYFDDLFVFTSSDDVAEHLVALERVLERGKDEQLHVKLSKCTFCTREIACLEDFIGADGIRMDPDETASLTELVKGKSRNERVDFNEEQLTCFNELKKRLAKPPVLAHPDSTKMFRVKMDASDYAVGGYLYQLDDVGQEHIIATLRERILFEEHDTASPGVYPALPAK
ncbi:hypothetical protein PR001_g5909 [Phytophthora rubi]|uniref:Reverse transcriptase domain-containing protein n=1 Tax=Phytophthora rubi TaxID=129364 RepID=A0A6A3NNI4_9STRA|nr:hypothetical protein PR001_g5909 [Phytophthora rubi]